MVLLIIIINGYLVRSFKTNSKKNAFETYQFQTIKVGLLVLKQMLCA